MFHRFEPHQWESTIGPGYRGRRFMAADVYREGDTFYVELDVPGVRQEDLDIEVEKKTLTISVSRPYDGSDDRANRVRERAFGSFDRRFFLGEGLDADGIEAALDNGVLKISIPMLETAQARKVEVAQLHSAIES